MSNIIQMNSSGALVPRTMAEAMQFAEMVAHSDMVPKDYKGKPANVLVAIQWGAELGLAPLQSLQNISVINGRPAVWGDAMLGMVQGSGLLQSINETIEGTGDNRVAVCEIQRKGYKPQVRRFSVEDAKRAGLWGRKNSNGSPAVWSQYPERMLQMRARAFALRDVFADVLKGMHIAEEARDIPVEVEDVTPPKPAKEEPRQIEAPKTPAKQPVTPPAKKGPALASKGQKAQVLTAMQALGWKEPDFRAFLETIGVADFKVMTSAQAEGALLALADLRIEKVSMV